MTREMLDDLLLDVPRHVAPDIDAAWRTGTTRRRRERAARLGVVGVVVAVGVLGLTRLEPSEHPLVGPAGKTVTVQGHPATVEKPFFGQSLPERPGPMAGTLETEGFGWHLIDENGRAWSFPTEPGSYLALSDDGTRVGALRHVDVGSAVYETVDLNTGVTSTYEDVGAGYLTDGLPNTDQPYWASEQAPAYWSPDGARLLIPGGRMDDDPATNGLLLEDGQVTALAVPGWPVGWASSSELVWLGYGGSTVRVTDISGRILREVALDPTQDLDGVSQWSGRVSPDGATLAVIDDKNDWARLRMFALDDGTVTSGPKRAGVFDSRACPPMWRGDEVAMWQWGNLTQYPGRRSVLELGEDWGPLTCTVWAADALAGPVQPPPGLTEWRYWHAWYSWRQILIAIGVLVVGVVAWTAYRRRYPRRTGPDDTVDWWGGAPT
jgi:hypothetical protein